MSATASTALGPVALNKDEGEALWFLGVLATIKASSETTDGRVAVIEHLAPQGAGSPLHVHHNEDEWFYVTEGDLSFWVGGISQSDFNGLNDPANHFPLVNRATQGQYAPGSTFKVVSSLALNRPSPFSTNGASSATSAMPSRVADIGLCSSTRGSPRLMASARRNWLSAIGPRMRPTTTGAIGKSNRRIRKPSTPKPASIDSSTTDGFAAMVLSPRWTPPGAMPLWVRPPELRPCAGLPPTAPPEMPEYGA